MTDVFIRYRRLPHQDVEGHPYFITACLAGSINALGLRKIREYREHLNQLQRPSGMDKHDWEERQHKKLFAFMDQILDHESPVRHLADDRQAEIVCQTMLHFAGIRYRLYAFVVMPSHHHWLFLPLNEWSTQAVQTARLKNPKVTRTPREIISKSVQQYTAKQCNRILGVTGAYWQHETFDHWARDEAEVQRIIDYIERNPVVTGLAKRPQDYRWSSARIRAELGLSPYDPIPRLPHSDSLKIEVDS